MKYRIRNQKDVAAGLVYAIAGAGFSIGALNYKIGEAARMGPGWFPLAIGILLVLVGIATAAAGMRSTTPEEKVKAPQLGAIAWITGAVVLFGLMLQPMGLVAALFALIVVSSFASHEFSWKATFVLAAVLILFCMGVFVWGISLQIPLWPSFIR